MKGQNPKNIMKNKSMTIAICLGVVLLILAVVLTCQSVIFNKDKNKGEEPPKEEGSEYMSYVGPVMPLIALDNDTKAKAEREIVFDFDTLKDGKKVPFMMPYNVTDSYIITNDTDEDCQVKFCYPSSAKLSYLANSIPYMTIDGDALDTELFFGPSISQFYTASTMSDKEKYYLISEFTSWTQYKELFETNEYFNEAQEKGENLDKPVTVYQLSNETGEAQAENGATLALEFTLNDSKSEILTYGINLLQDGSGDGQWKFGYSVPQNNNVAFSAARYLIVVGGDIGDYKLQGYKDVTCAAGAELEISADVKRYETTLGKILEDILNYHNSKFNNKTDVKTIMLGASSGDLADLIEGHIRFDEKIKAGETSGAKYFRLEDVIGQTLDSTRILYQTFTVEIPAKASRKVEAIMYKNPSQNNTDGDKTAEKAYDLLTQTDMNLEFLSQRATINNWNNIEISNQNFGFDIGNNVTSVELEEEYFYLEVKEIE